MKKLWGTTRLTAAGGAVILQIMLSFGWAADADAGCWSLLKSPKWADMQASLNSAKLCEVIPAGPNRTKSLSITMFDVCDAPGGISLNAEASIECGSSSGALIKISASASLKAKVAIDIGTCSVTDAQLELSGDAGKLLARRPEFQTLVRGLAQTKLSELCGKDRVP